MLSLEYQWRDEHFPSAGSGKDDCYSSSTQKQSIDTIATSRNTSLKKYKIAKAFADGAACKVPSAHGVGSSNLRFLEGSDAKNCHSCLTAKVNKSNINIFSGSNINEIHLNIFPPSVTYVKELIHACPRTSQAEEKGGCLNIDVREKLNQKSISEATEPTEAKRKVSQGYISQVSVKRCDSILHISIGNSSKITKRHKRNPWMFANVWKLLRRKKTLAQRKCSFGSQFSGENVHRLSNRSLNVLNDDLIISINKRSYGDSLPFQGSMSHDSYSKQIPPPGDFIGTGELENGANELDCYMNEIKRREMRWYETWTA